MRPQPTSTRFGAGRVLLAAVLVTAVLVIPAVVIVRSAHPTGTDKWTTFAPAGAGFSVLLPGEPTLSTRTYETASGDAPASFWMVKVSTDLIYTVMLGKYPEGTVSKQAPATALDNGLGHAGKSFTLAVPGGTIMGEMFSAGDNLYMAYVVSALAAEDAPTFAAFLESFTLTV